MMCLHSAVYHIHLGTFTHPSGCLEVGESKLHVKFYREWRWIYSCEIEIQIKKSENIDLDRVGWRSGDALDSYSIGSRFEFRPGHRLSVLRFFMVLFCSSRQMPG